VGGVGSLCGGFEAGEWGSRGGVGEGGGGGGGRGRYKGVVVGVGVGVELASWARKRWEVGR